MSMTRRAVIGGILAVSTTTVVGRLVMEEHVLDDERSFPLPKPGQGVAVSPNGQRVAVLYRWGDGIDVFARDGGLIRRIRRIGTLASPEIAFLDDDHVVAPAGEGFGPDAMLQVWKVADQSAPRTINGSVPGGDFLHDRAKIISVGGGGRWIAAFCDRREADGVSIVDVATWEVRAIALRTALGRFDRVSCIGAADLLAVGTVGGRLLLLDPVSGDLLRDVTVYPRGPGYPLISVGGVAFGDDGRLVATGRTISATGTVAERYGTGADGADGLKVWKVADGSLVRTASHDAKTARRIASGVGMFIAFADIGRLISVPFDPLVPDAQSLLPGVVSLDVSPLDRLAVVVNGRSVRRLPLPLGS